MKLFYRISFLILFASQSFGQGSEFDHLDSLRKIGGLYINDTIVKFRDDRSWTLSPKADTIKIQRDHEFWLLGVRNMDTLLILSFAYGGGCGPVYLRLYVNESANFIKDPVIELFPEFIDRDHCRAIKFGYAYFDINKLTDKRKKPLKVKVGEYLLTIPK